MAENLSKCEVTSDYGSANLAWRARTLSLNVRHEGQLGDWVQLAFGLSPAIAFWPRNMGKVHLTDAEFSVHQRASM